MVETLQEKTYRLALAVAVTRGTEVCAFADAITAPGFEEACLTVARAQCEALREAVKLHAFTHPDGNRYILAENLTDWANDIEQGIAK